MKRRRMSPGFTLIELVMVVVIIGILAVVAIPKYFSLQTEAKQAAEDGVVASVRSGVMTYYAKNQSFPSALDSASDGDASASNLLFTNVLTYGISKDWTKAGDTYTGPAGGSYSYDSSDGSFD